MSTTEHTPDEALTAPSQATPTAARTKQRRLLRRLMVVLIGGMVLDGYVMGIIGTVISIISVEMAMTPYWEGLIVASSLIGIFLGAPIGGWASDKFGRKPLFMMDMGLFVAASFAQLFVETETQLFLVRLAMGVAVGMEYAVGWPMLSEFAPRRARGKVLALNLVAFYVGFMIAFLVGYVLTTQTDTSWRHILATSTFFALVLFFARFGLPESARWLMGKGRVEEAHRVAELVLEHPEDIDDIKAEQHSHGRFSMLFSRRHWRTTLFTSVFWLCAVTPYYAIASFAQKVLENYGLASGLAGGVGLSALATAGVITTVFLIDRFGRRPMCVYPQWLCAFLLLILGLWSGAPALLVLTFFLTFSFFNAMYNTFTGIYPGELFPTEIRGVGTGFATSISRIGAAAGTFALPWSMVTFGTGLTMVGVAALAFVGAALSQWLAPETTGKSLTEAASGFGH